MTDCSNFKIDSQKGKIFVVTGGNSGLGYYTSLDLARAEGKVILAVRSVNKGVEAKNDILKLIPNAQVDVMELNLASFDSIREFAKNFAQKYGTLDVLINNAGIMALPEKETTLDGLEAQMGTNHMGHFLLTSLLYPLLKSNGRVINHSSGAHRLSGPDMLDDIHCEKSYKPWAVYGNSKAANLLFTYELNTRLKSIGNPKNIISVAVHPGYTATNLQVHLPMAFFSNLLFGMKGEIGSLSQTLAAVGPNVQPSYRDYIGPAYRIWGCPKAQSTLDFTWDPIRAKQLWEMSVKLTGATDFPNVI